MLWKILAGLCLSAWLMASCEEPMTNEQKIRNLEAQIRHEYEDRSDSARDCWRIAADMQGEKGAADFLKVCLEGHRQSVEASNVAIANIEKRIKELRESGK